MASENLEAYKTTEGKNTLPTQGLLLLLLVANILLLRCKNNPIH